jgi:hypothetical protein
LWKAQEDRTHLEKARTPGRRHERMAGSVPDKKQAIRTSSGLPARMISAC